MRRKQVYAFLGDYVGNTGNTVILSSPQCRLLSSHRHDWRQAQGRSQCDRRPTSRHLRLGLNANAGLPKAITFRFNHPRMALPFALQQVRHFVHKGGVEEPTCGSSR